VSKQVGSDSFVGSKQDTTGEGHVPSSVRCYGDSSSSLGDRVFKGLTAMFAGLVLVLAIMVAWELYLSARPAIDKFGWGFLSSSEWDPVQEMFGSVPFVYGTLASSFLALLIATPLGLGIALFLTELSPRNLREPIGFLVEILAAIPSVVYGLWGIFVLAPVMRTQVDPFLAEWIGGPLFVPPTTGLSLITAGFILAIMILPTITAISREVFEAVPNVYRESALALGATKWEAIQLAVVKASKPGILGALMLGLGRALGETMAVTMVIGNKPEVSANLLAASHSMASVIANEFSEAVSDMHISALAALGLLLMVLTLVLNVLARVLVWATTRKFRGVK
jgi:phosphate transport system permease protein